MYCGNCGKKVKKGDEYCGNCGSRVKSGREVIEGVFRDLKNFEFDKALKKINSAGGAVSAEPAFKIKGDIFFLKGDYKEASKNYTSIPPETRNWDTSLNLALIYINKNETVKALKCLEGIKESGVGIPDSFIYSGKYNNREELFADIFLYMGVLYRETGKKNEAVKSFQKVLKYDGVNDLAHANLGDVFFKDDNYDRAVEHYQTAIKLSPDKMKKSHLFNDLGFAYFRKGLIDDAVENFKNAVMLNPENHDAVKNDYREFIKQEEGADILFNLTRSIMSVAKKETGQDVDVDFIGESPSVKEVKKIIMRASETDGTVFIQGENGTGKELAARAIHRLSSRGKKPFVVVNCGALPETLLESELFGYEKGAFTGAVKEKQGRFELADTGTVFLDEIGDVTRAMQVKLLRFVQEKEFEMVGGTETKKVDVRIITATNRDIRKLVEEGKFREDLFYRLYVLPITIPPLRDRGGDIGRLAESFLKYYSGKNSKKFRSISQEAMEIFYNYRWPGNVRELENVIERIVTLYDGAEIKKEHLPEELMIAAHDSKTLIHNQKYNEINKEKENIREILKQVNYSKTKAAERLGISRVGLWKKMKRMGIQ